jgi:alpha-L-fucosidase
MSRRRRDRLMVTGVVGGGGRNSLLNGLLAYWRMDESSGGSAPTTRVDQISTSNLSDINTCASAQGKNNAAAAFVAARNEYLEVASNPALTVGDFDFTIDAFVNLSSLGTTNKCIFSVDDNSGALRSLAFAVNTSNQLVCWLWDTAGTLVTHTASSLPTLEQDTWYYVAVAHDSVNDKFYIRLEDQVQEFARPLGIRSTASKFRVGAQGSNGNPMNGAIDEVGKWNRVLTADEFERRRAGSYHPFDGSSTAPVGTAEQEAYIALQRGVAYHWNMPTFTGEEVGSGNLNPNTFAPTGLDIDQWLDAAVSAGAQYAFLTTKHPDGFALWPTQYAVSGYLPYSVERTAWYAANGNPDVVGLFVTKCRARNLGVVLYFSMWDITYEIRSGKTLAQDPAGYKAMIEAQLTELLTNYGPITALWFDGWGWHLHYDDLPYEPMRAFIKAIQPTCLVIENSHEHPVIHSEIECYETPVEGAIPLGNTRFCEEINTIRLDGKWFYHPTDDQTAAALMTVEQAAAAYARANNNHANYLLSCTPGKDGLLPAAQVAILAAL